jgi:hypothetical protein
MKIKFLADENLRRAIVLAAPAARYPRIPISCISLSVSR